MNPLPLSVSARHKDRRRRPAERHTASSRCSAYERYLQPGLTASRDSEAQMHSRPEKGEKQSQSHYLQNRTHHVVWIQRCSRFGKDVGDARVHDIISSRINYVSLYGIAVVLATEHAAVTARSRAFSDQTTCIVNLCASPRWLVRVYHLPMPSHPSLNVSRFV